jgi:hypothetical protein
MDIRDILRSFGFGIMHQEKSGNPDVDPILQLRFTTPRVAWRVLKTEKNILL